MILLTVGFTAVNQRKTKKKLKTLYLILNLQRRFPLPPLFEIVKKILPSGLKPDSLSERKNICWLTMFYNVVDYCEAGFSNAKLN